MRETDFDTVIACQDKFIRIIQGSNLILEIPINNSVTMVRHLEWERESVPFIRRPRCLVYGTAKGDLGLITIDPTNNSYEIVWEIEDNPEKKSEITCCMTCDINKDLMDEIIIGRDDGRLEIYKLSHENIKSPPSLIFLKDIGKCSKHIDFSFDSNLNVQF